MQDTIITLVGNVATQPEQYRTGAGDPITRFRVASSSRRWDRGSGRWQDGTPSYYAVSVFRGLGEHAIASLSKGDRVVLSGRLKIREWDTGEKRGTAAEIEVDAIGHDLAFGTTSYTRRVGKSAERAETRDDDWAPEPQAPEAPGAQSGDPSVLTTHWTTAEPGSAETGAESADAEKELLDTPF